MAKKVSKPHTPSKKAKKNSFFDYLLILLIIAGGAYFAYYKFLVDPLSSTSDSLTEAERKRFGSELVPINPNDNLTRGLPKDFVTFSKRATPKETDRITSLFNNELGLNLSPFNTTAETIFNYSTISDCNTFNNFLDLGIVDPFIHACFQRKQNDLQILYQQKNCSYAGFLITSQLGPDSKEELNNENISILGKGRVRALAKSAFPKNGPVKFKNVYVDQNASRAQADSASRSIGAFFVLGFKINGRHSIPFLNIGDVDDLESTNPSLKVIERFDYNLPCSIVVASQTIADSITPQQKSDLLSKLNQDDFSNDLLAITSQPNKFEIVEPEELNKSILKNILAMLDEEINTENVGIRGYNSAENKESLDFNSNIAFPANDQRPDLNPNESASPRPLNEKSNDSFEID